MFFDHINNLDVLKETYRKLAKVYHPDQGGTDEMFKNLKQEFENRKLFIETGKIVEPKKTTEAQQAPFKSHLEEILSNPMVQDLVKAGIDQFAANLQSALLKGRRK